MRSRLMQILEDADCRHLTAEEESALLAYASSLPQRLQAARQIARVEEESVRAALDEIKRRYPNFQGLHERAWEKSSRDMALVLRHVVQGMIADDLEMASEKLFYWLRTIVAAAGITPGFIRDAYGELREALRARITADQYALLEPHMTRCIETLSDFPEPYKAAV